MKRYWKIGLAGILLGSFALISVGKEAPPAFIEMEVKGVRVDLRGQNPVVILAEKAGPKALPIWIGFLEATAIEKEIEKIPNARPMTHDLFHTILTKARIKVKEVKITELKDQTYYSTLFLTSDKGLMEVDARPSDAIILSMKAKTPIWVSAKIIEEQGIILERENLTKERHGIRIQELTPSLASHFNFKGQTGVLVSEVVSGSPSDISGVRAGDIITRIGMKEVNRIQDFVEIFDGVEAGGSVRISFFRDGKNQEINLKLNP
jgi:bifunctional DNase/RNase